LDFGHFLDDEFHSALGAFGDFALDVNATFGTIELEILGFVARGTC
jgi:hypothetical protein